MADNHAFDIVSEVNTAEMHNAVVQAQHEIAVRYDFKGTKASIEYDKKENKLTLEADHKGQLDTVVQMLKEKMAKRGVAVSALVRGKIEEATHESVREVVTLHVGIETDDAKKIVKQIKGLGIKVQSQIMDSKVRVTAKKIDELQDGHRPTSRRTAPNTRSSSTTSPDRQGFGDADPILAAYMPAAHPARLKSVRAGIGHGVDDSP